ncbi:MAG: LapA family protein [Paracoccaceae bacterium]|nr:LapA family protein [Paracoccaceae bacterium]MDP7186781.1 LapA family protein [Paracoccaceae bacterium]
MRYIRYGFMAILGVALVAVAFGNRDSVMLRLLPDELSGVVGFSWSVELPLFIVVFASIIFGLVIGFIWEWIREAGLRGEAARHRHEVGQLKREVRKLKTEPTEPQDEVLALLEDAK